MAVLLTVDQKVKFSIQPLDVAGNPAPVQGVPMWALSDATYGATVVAPDGLSAYFVPAGKTGQVQVRVSADADLGAGVRTIAGVADVTIAAGGAVSLAMTAAAPEPK